MGLKSVTKTSCLPGAINERNEFVGQSCILATNDSNGDNEVSIHKTFSISYNKIFDLGGLKDYIYRWSLWLPFGLSLKVHKIVRPDNDRCEHDHPWWFVRFILHGGYIEVVRGKKYNRLPWRPWAFWRVYPCLPSFQHKIIKLHKKVNWSLVLCGRNRGTWGFITKKGWIEWNRFLTAGKKAVVLWCSEA